jgi:hypothetical protein
MMTSGWMDDTPHYTVQYQSWSRQAIKRLMDV